MTTTESEDFATVVAEVGRAAGAFVGGDPQPARTSPDLHTQRR
jgi:hypothetical protein